MNKIQDYRRRSPYSPGPSNGPDSEGFLGTVNLRSIDEICLTAAWWTQPATEEAIIFRVSSAQNLQSCHSHHTPSAPCPPHSSQPGPQAIHGPLHSVAAFTARRENFSNAWPIPPPAVAYWSLHLLSRQGLHTSAVVACKKLLWNFSQQTGVCLISSLANSNNNTS